MYGTVAGTWHGIIIQLFVSVILNSHFVVLLSDSFSLVPMESSSAISDVKSPVKLVALSHSVPSFLW